MYISICRNFLLAITLLFSSISPCFAVGNNSEEAAYESLKGISEQELHTLLQESLEPYFKRALDQVHSLDCILQDVAFNLANNASIKTKSRANVIITIRTIRELLTELQTTSYVVLSPQLIDSYISILRATIDSVAKGLRRGIDYLEPVDLTKIKFQYQEDMSLEQLEKALIYNDNQIAALVKSADSLGLHWYNKVYRGFKHCIVRPIQTLAPYALIGGTLSASALLAWYYCGGENPKWLRDKLGYPQLSDFGGQGRSIEKETTIELCKIHNKEKDNLMDALIINNIDQKTREDLMRNISFFPIDTSTTQPSLLDRVEHTIFRLTNGRYMVGAKLFAMSQAILGIYGLRCTTFMKNNLEAIDNFLMGGCCKNRQVGDYIYSSDVTFDDIIGQEDAKKYGHMLCQYLKNPELFLRTRIAPATSILLHGETRTGKSHFISALFGEIKKTLGDDGASFKMLRIKFEEIQKYGIEKIIESARYAAPMILVIEEIDLLGLQRTTNPQLLAEFMTALSSCLQENNIDKNVIIIGTTNKLENLEPALRTEGRFGKHIYFDYPKYKERKLFIERELAKTACNLAHFDISRLARDTEGCSFEKLALFIKRTFLRAKLYNETVDQAAFERSIDENIRNISSNEITLDEEQKNIVAAHLAGHVVANVILDPHQKISKVTLHDVANKIDEQLAVMTVLYKDAKQDAVEHGKIFANYDRDMFGIEGKEEKIKQCKIALAGYAAEIILLGSCGRGYHPQDEQSALNIAKSIICGNMDLTTLTDNIRDKYFDAAFELMKKCELEVAQLLEEHREELTALMTELIKKATLDGNDIRRIVLKEENTKTELLDAKDMVAELLKGQSEFSPAS